MSLIKTPEEIIKLHRGGVILSQTLREIRAACVPGASTQALDKLARQRFAEAGGKPLFLNYRLGKDTPPYPGALCVSINEEVVHGLSIPDRIIKDGDVVGLDLGLWHDGLSTDMATTVIAGKSSRQVRKLVAATRQALVEGLKAVKDGNFVADIGATIEDFLKPKGYGIVRDLVGHGVGHAIHEEPQIPNYRDPRAAPFKLRAGMVLAIEPMVTLGGWQVRIKDDGWTVVTSDGSLSAHFEVTVAVTKDGYDLITPWPDE